MKGQIPKKKKSKQRKKLIIKYTFKQFISENKKNTFHVSF